MDWGGGLDDDEKADTGRLPLWAQLLTMLYLAVMIIVMLRGVAEFLQPIISLFGTR